MKLTISAIRDECCGCAACAAICPCSCIEMRDDDLGFPYPTVDDAKCIGCAICRRACPILSEGYPDESLSTFWAKSKSENLLFSSSSGGVFGTLAHGIIQGGGSVYGAVFSNDYLSVFHDRADSDEAMRKMQKSKYVQSIVKPEVYLSVVEDLLSGKAVLFSGTACQVSGMHGFLREKGVSTDGLLLVEVFCHGVPSPALWKKWIRYQVEDDVALSSVDFRDKTSGWVDYSVSYSYGGQVSRIGHADDWYMKAFLANASLRPSCFSCGSKRRCSSDIVLGDYWGIEKHHPDLPATEGISAVLINTPKGERAFECIKNHLEFGLSDERWVLASNPSLACSSTACDSYQAFMEDVRMDMPMKVLVSKWSFSKHKSLAKRVAGALKRKIKRRNSHVR